MKLKAVHITISTLLAAPSAWAGVNQLDTPGTIFTPALIGESSTPGISASWGVVSLGGNRFLATIDQRRFQIFSAPETAGAQRKNNWCWAACIQMVLNYYGVPISQSQIVQYVYGSPIDQAAGSREILATFQNWFATLGGQYVRLKAVLLDPTRTAEWVQIVGNGQPVIAGLAGATPTDTGHAYVVKAIEYSLFTTGIVVHSLVLADPWPESPAEKVMSWDEFSRRQSGLYAIF